MATDSRRSASIRFDVDAQAAKAALQELAQTSIKVMNEAGGAVERQTPRLAAMSKAVETLSRTYDPLGNAMRKAGQDQAELNRLLAAGKISADDYARILPGIQARQEAVALATNGVGKAAGFTATQMSILQSGAINTFQSIAAGLPIGQTLLTQATQTAPAFAGMARSILGVGAPLGALAAAGLIVGGRMASISAESRQVDEVLKRLNPTLDASAEKLRKLSFDVSAQTGTGRSDAMSGITQLARVRDLQSQFLEPLARLAPDLATLLGEDVAQAATKLGKGFSDGADGVKALHNEVQFLTPAQLKQIELLDQQGKKTDVYRIALGALTQQIGGTAAAMQSDFGAAASAMGRSWDEFVENATNSSWTVGVTDFLTASVQGWNKILQGLGVFDKSPIKGDGLAERVNLLGRRQELEAALRGQAPRSLSAAGLSSQIADINAQIAALDAAPVAAVSIQGLPRRDVAPAVKELKDRISEEEKAAKQIRDRAIAEQQAVEATLVGMQAQRDAASALADVTGQGVQASREITVAAEAERTVRQALAAATLEGNKARIAELKAVQESIRLTLLDKAAQEDRAKYTGLVQQREDELKLIQMQGDLISARPEIVARETAELRERLRIQRSGTEEEKAHAGALIASAGQIAEMSSRMSEFQRVAQHTTDQIVDAVGSMWDPGRRSFASFKDLVLRGFREIVANSVIRPIVAPIVAGTIGSVMGVGSAAASTGGAAGGGALFSSLGGLGNIGGLFSGSGLLSAASLDGIGAALGFATSALPGTVAGTGLMAGAAAGSPFAMAQLGAQVPGSIFGSTSLSGMLGGAGLGGLGGLGASLLGLGSGNALLDAGLSMGGGMLGTALLTPFLGPFAPLVGGFAGQALGSLFKKKPSVGPNGFGYYTLGAGGAEGFGLDWVGKDNGYNPQAAVDMGGDFAADFQKLIQGLGGTGFADATGGQLSYTVGKHPGVEGIAINVIRNGGSVSGDPKGFDDSTKAADYLFRQLLENGVVEGLSDQVNAVIRKSADIRENLSDVAADVAFAKSLYETNPLNPEKLTAFEQSMKALGDQFAELKTRAEDLGIATSLVSAKYEEAQAALKAGFAKSIDDQLLEIRNPQAYALQQWQEWMDTLRKEATAAGADLAKIEELGALKRAEVLRNAMGGVLDQLRDYGLSLRTGGLSPLAPGDQYAGLRATFESTAAQALTGDLTAQGKLQSASQAFLEASKAYNASSEAFAADWSRVTGIIDQVTGGAPAGFTSLAASAQATNDNLAVMAVMQDESLGYTRLMAGDTRRSADALERIRDRMDQMAVAIADLNLRLRAS